MYQQELDPNAEYWKRYPNYKYQPQKRQGKKTRKYMRRSCDRFTSRVEENNRIMEQLYDNPRILEEENHKIAIAGQSPFWIIAWYHQLLLLRRAPALKLHKMTFMQAIMILLSHIAWRIKHLIHCLRHWTTLWTTCLTFQMNHYAHYHHHHIPITLIKMSTLQMICLSSIKTSSLIAMIQAAQIYWVPSQC